MGHQPKPFGPPTEIYATIEEFEENIVDYGRD
jgi:hypothetical protein